MAYHPNRIAYYRERCRPPLTQAGLARLLGKHLNTVQNWEKQGAPSAADLLGLAEVFVERGALADYEAALAFWRLSGREREPFAVPVELRGLFAREGHERAALLPTDRLPAPAPLPRMSRVPYHRNRLFVGRGGDLLELARALDPPDSVVVVSGIAGLGKTQLACEFAHHYGQRFPGGVFWVSFADPSAVAAGVAACGGPEHLDLRPDFDALPLEKQARLVLAAWREPAARLLVFDNCEDEALLADWRPTTGGCRVLVTSRRARWSPTLVAHVLPLRGLGRDESVALLRGHCANLPEAARLADAESQPALDAIAAELGDLPLALHLAGAYLAHWQPDLTPARYLAELRGASALAARVSSALEHVSLQGGALSPTRHHQHLARAFALSYQRLRPGSPTDALALGLLARAARFADGEPLPRALLLSTVVAASDAPAEARAPAEDGLARLVGDLGLLEQSAGGALRMHRLVAAFVRAADVGAEAQEAVERVMLDEANRLNEARLPQPMRELQPHLRAVAEAALARADARAAQLCAALGWQLTLLGALDDAKAYLRRALAIREAAFGPDHPETAASLNLLGLACQYQSEYAAAQRYLERALAIWERALPPDALELCMVHNTLGYLLRARGEYAAARYHLERALASAERLRGVDHPDTARNLNNLGYLLFEQGEHAAARRHLERALAIRERALPANHPATAQTLNNLGDVLCHQQHYDEAWACHQRALAMRQATYGPLHNDTAESLKNLGRVLFGQGDYDSARPYFEQSLSICASTLGPDHVETGWSLELLGELHYAQEDFHAAAAYFRRALAIFERQLGDTHEDTHRARRRLADLDLAR
jgi:tetratricopeptide (TPR) repeat protein